VVDGDMFDIGGPWALNNNGSLGSGFLGYRHDFGDFVLGAEVSSTLMVDVFQAAFPTWEFTRLTDIRATAGYEVGPALVYAAGGYTTSAFTPGAGSLTYDGWNAGVGVDFALTDNFFIGGEYIYRSISRTTNRNWTADFSTIQVRAGIRF